MLQFRRDCRSKDVRRKEISAKWRGFEILLNTFFQLNILTASRKLLMHLLDHVSISVPNLERARPFYDAVMSALGCEKVYDRPDALGYGVRCRTATPDETYLAVYLSAGASNDERRHWCFKASSRAAVHDFHEAALQFGGSSDGPPGLRETYHPTYYAAFVHDPYGNRIEAVCHVPE